MPSTRNEEYRYTDISPLLNAALAPAPADAAVDTQQLEQLAVPEAAGSRVVLVNGVFRPELSDLAAVGEGVYVGGAAGAPAEAVQQLVSHSCRRCLVALRLLQSPRTCMFQMQLQTAGCLCSGS
jgi:Fe-S cluster assembly protein SufD